MTAIRLTAILSVLLVLLSIPASAEVLITPLQIDRMDSSSAVIINELFIESYQSFTKERVRMAEEGVACRDRACALDAAQAAGAGEVIYGVARKLGEKWIVSCWRLKTADGSVISSNRLDAKSIEDFEYVMRRVAEGLATGKRTDKIATIDNVTENEMSDRQFRRREGYYAFGIKFGYLFPTPGTDSYSRYVYDWNNSASDYRLQQYSQILNTDIINWFELPKDLALEWDLHVGWGTEIGSQFSLLKIFSRSDFSPFAGGGIGIDYVFPDDNADDLSNKRNGGFSLNGKAGMMFFRTYDFRLLASVGYKAVLNSDLDQGFTADLGIIWRKSPRASRGSGNVVTNGLAIIGASLLGLIVLSIALNNY